MSSRKLPGINPKPIWELSGQELAEAGRRGAAKARARIFQKYGFIYSKRNGHFVREFGDGRIERVPEEEFNRFVGATRFLTEGDGPLFSYQQV